MKRSILPFLFLFGIFFITIAVFAEGNRSITILYTGSVKGTIDPLIGCSCGSSGSVGGLARRAQMIESIRNDNKSVLLLDNGAVFNNQKDNAELNLKAMGRMGYDALNLGIPEVSFGKSLLERNHSQASFPFISSNLLYDGGRLSWIQEYFIKEVGGIKVAILGVVDPEDLKKIPPEHGAKVFEAVPPEAAIKKLMSELKGKADLVVLLSQLGEARTIALAEAIAGIDVAIFSERNILVKPPEKNVIVLQAAMNGTSMGLLTVAFDEKGVRSVSARRDIPLDESVPENGQILAFVETYEKEQEIKEENQKKELLEGLTLTPQEFMERYRQKQAEQQKGEAQ